MVTPLPWESLVVSRSQTVFVISGNAFIELTVNWKNVVGEAAHENEPRLAVPSCHGSDIINTNRN